MLSGDRNAARDAHARLLTPLGVLRGWYCPSSPYMQCWLSNSHMIGPLGCSRRAWLGAELRLPLHPPAHHCGRHLPPRGERLPLPLPCVQHSLHYTCRFSIDQSLQPTPLSTPPFVGVRTCCWVTLRGTALSCVPLRTTLPLIPLPAAAHDCARVRGGAEPDCQASEGHADRWACSLQGVSVLGMQLGQQEGRDGA